KTGAVIITGETATKKNAEEMIHHLSDYAGEFIVATAGADLEGIIAAKGSGAYEFSKINRSRVIANIDIGGGTANVAVYKAGKLCGTCTLHIGGRLIRFFDDRIGTISEPIKNLLHEWKSDLKEGRTFSLTEIESITDYMAQVIGRMLKRELTATDKNLLLGHEPNWNESINAIMFSGGIGECIYQYEKNSSDPQSFNDIGMILAKSLTTASSLSDWEWIRPQETVRATVLGAGAHTTEISGATIEVEKEDLPIKNLPVYEICFENDFLKGIKKIPFAIKEAIDMYDSYNEGQNFSIYFSKIPHIGFKEVHQLVDCLLNSMKQVKHSDVPLVIVLESDLAKVVGQTIKMIQPKQKIICIDQIQVEHGDYLDIGQVLQTNVVPVVIKTLTFHQ
ncbi:MAG: ethanolamine ammonia-lyase reactivating factor EutA, partial [Bacillota bacterium]|nr:ethanolamine ammonia-lyase reactivating factor EutA [Bacillota bacterium]